MRSRAVSLPRACWRSTAAGAPRVQGLLAQRRELLEPFLDGMGYRPIDAQVRSIATTPRA